MESFHIKCQGCHGVFSRSGYVQHVTRTQRWRCRAVGTTSQARAMSQSLSQTVSSLVPNTNSIVFEEANSEGGRNLASQRPNHQLTATHVVDNNGKL
jgi:hypothetical protein